MNEENKIEYQDAKAITTNGEYYGYIKYQSYMMLVVFMAVGILLMLMQNLIGYVTGIIFLVTALVLMVKVKNRKVIEFYSEGIVVHNHDNDELAIWLNAEEIELWEIDERDRSYIKLHVRDNGVMLVETFQFVKANRLLSKCIPNASKVEMQRKYTRNIWKKIKEKIL